MLPCLKFLVLASKQVFYKCLSVCVWVGSTEFLCKSQFAELWASFRKLLAHRNKTQPETVLEFKSNTADAIRRWLDERKNYIGGFPVSHRNTQKCCMECLWAFRTLVASNAEVLFVFAGKPDRLLNCCILLTYKFWGTRQNVTLQNYSVHSPWNASDLGIFKGSSYEYSYCSDN